MRKAEFYVPSEVMAEFAQELSSRDLTNSITGITEDDDIIVEVEYDKSESDEVDELEEKLDSLCSELENEEEEDDDDKDESKKR
jgi:2-oxo-4-hydroxy-4-carboxy--5-ureidoimidazoline (OHCU) decarboxylase